MAEAAGARVSQSDGESSGKITGGPLSVIFPCDVDVWNEARRLVSNKNLRVEDLATCASQDPVLVMELLKTSNALYFAGGKSAITAVKTAIVRLGSDVLIELLDKLKERGGLEGEEVNLWFESHRSRCRRTGIVARIVAEALARHFADDCQAAALLMYIGEMLAVAHFKETYVKLARDLSRSGLIYRLAQEHRFDVESMGLAYCRHYGIPEALLAAIDREARPRTPDRAVMKPICFASCEMVDAFDLNRWEKLAPGKSLPPKSSIRMLQINDQQYLKIYERCSEYLFSARLLEERKKQKAEGGQPEFADPIVLGTSIISPEESALQNEIQNLLQAGGESATQMMPMVEAEILQAEGEPEPLPPPVVEDDFSLDAAKMQVKTEARVRPGDAVVNQPVPELISVRAQELVSQASDMFGQAASSEEVITKLLEMLVDRGPFEKSALIVVSKDRKRAIVVAARGPSVGNGQKLTLDDPLSPIAQCFSKIQSYGNRESPNSPFGSKSYALAPVNADHDTPVALYADCGNQGSVSFEARRVFRVVVELLNQKLPQVAGGIPIEV